MNYKPYIGWGFYYGAGGTGANRAAGYTSWGLKTSLPTGPAVTPGVAAATWRKFLLLYNRAKPWVRSATRTRR